MKISKARRALRHAVPLASATALVAGFSTLWAHSGHSHDHQASARAASSNAQAYLDRIAQIDDSGPQLNAVISVNHSAPDAAAELASKGLLRGRTVLVKDNIETRELPTTAGSLALAGNMTRRDAPLIAAMRKSGGVVLGKTNLSEWANIRDNDSTSGWSAVGGLVRNPHATDRNACGSSSGSGAAVAAQLAWAAIGTETNGSITCPASVNGVVGFKPSVGLVSRTHIVPISSTQDTAGPMARSVHDAALLLSAIAAPDPSDPITLTAPRRRADFTKGLDDFTLRGVRIGVMRNQIGNDDAVSAVFANAVDDLEKAGAVLIDIEFSMNEQIWGDSFTVLMFELRREMNRYLASLPGEGLPRSMAELIAFNTANADAEMRWFGQDLFEQAQETTDQPAYEQAHANAVRIAGEDTLDALFADHKVNFLIAPTRGPAWPNDLVLGDNFNGSIGFGTPAAIAGYPHLTVPMGAVERLPVGLSFFGAKWSDFKVLQAGAAYERARSAALVQPGLEPWKPVIR